MDTNLISFLSFSIFALCQVGVIYHDLAHFRIPNVYPVLLVLSFTFMAVINESLFPFTSIDLINHAASGVVLLLLGFSLFSLGIIGGGDAKIAAATGLWFGWPLILDYLIYASVVGAVLAVIVVTFKLTPLGRNRGESGHGKAKYVPFGVALGVSSLIVATYTPFFQGAMSFISYYL